MTDSVDQEPHLARSVGIIVSTRLKTAILLAAVPVLAWLPGPSAVAGDSTVQADTSDQAITIGVFIIDVSKIEEREQQVEMDLGLRVNWQVPSLADDSAPAIRTLPLDLSLIHI